MKKLQKSIMLALSFVMVLSMGFVATAGQSDAASTYLATNGGVTYQFKQSVHSPSFKSSNSGYIKISLKTRCTTSSGYYIVNLQKLVNGQWVNQSKTSSITCSTSTKRLVRTFGYQSAGTYRIQFYRMSGTNTKIVSYWGVYRSTTP